MSADNAEILSDTRIQEISAPFHRIYGFDEVGFARALLDEHAQRLATLSELGRIAKLVVDHYPDKPDDFTLSLGGWETDKVLGAPHQDFTAYLAIPMSDWRRYAEAVA